MNTVAMKNEIAFILKRCLYKKRHMCARYREVAVVYGEETAIRWAIDTTIRSCKGGKYVEFVEKYEPLNKYLSERLVLAVDIPAKDKKNNAASKLRRLARLMAYCAVAKRHGRTIPPECSMPEFDFLFEEGGVR